MGLERWIALQLSPERINDVAGDSVVASYQTLSAPTSELTSMFREARMARLAQKDTSRLPVPAPVPSPQSLAYSVG